jgi:hypothetical protein
MVAVVVVVQDLIRTQGTLLVVLETQLQLGQEAYSQVLLHILAKVFQEIIIMAVVAVLVLDIAFRVQHSEEVALAEMAL